MIRTLPCGWMKNWGRKDTNKKEKQEQGSDQKKKQKSRLNQTGAFQQKSKALTAIGLKPRQADERIDSDHTD